MSKVWVGLLMSLTLAAGCVQSDRDALHSEERDSAGVTIVTYDPIAFADLPRWVVSEAPMVDIGSNIDADPRYELFRVESIDELSTGEIVVLNAGTLDVRVYDAAGQYVQSVGRGGSGPGEFGQPRWLLAIAGDTIVVYDHNQRRLTFFSRNGELGRTVDVAEAAPGHRAALGVLQTGSLLIPFASDFPPSMTGGLSRDSVTLQRISLTGERLPPFGTYPGMEMYWLVDGNRVMGNALEFGKSLAVAAGDSLIYLGTTDQWEIQVRDHSGNLHRILRVSAKPRPVTRSMIEAFLSQPPDAEGDSAILAQQVALRQAMPFPETSPAFCQLAVDDAENLWVRSYPVHPDSNPDWHVFTAEGRLLAGVRLPERVDVRIISNGRIIGLYKDELAIEHVRVYELHR